MTAIDQFAAHVGLDWADKKHDVCVQFKNGERTFHVINHTPESLDTWLNELHQKVKGRIAIALEMKKGPVVYALQKYPFVTVFPVHALSLARYRQTFSPSGAKRALLTGNPNIARCCIRKVRIMRYWMVIPD